MIRLVVRAAAGLSASSRAEGRLIAAEWAEQVAARPTVASRASHAVMLLVSVGLPARARRWVLRPRWVVITMVLLVLGAVLTIGSYQVRDWSEGVFRNYGPEEQAADPEYQAWEARYGEAVQTGDSAAREEALARLMKVGPWRRAESLRKLADVTLVAGLGPLALVPITGSLAAVRWRWRRRPRLPQSA